MRLLGVRTRTFACVKGLLWLLYLTFSNTLLLLQNVIDLLPQFTILVVCLVAGLIVALPFAELESVLSLQIRQKYLLQHLYMFLPFTMVCPHVAGAVTTADLVDCVDEISRCWYKTTRISLPRRYLPNYQSTSRSHSDNCGWTLQ